MSLRRTSLLSLILLTLNAAALGAISSPVFRIEASNTMGSDSFEVSSGDLTLVPNLGGPGIDGWTWSLPAAEYLSSGMNDIATLTSASLTLVDHPFAPRIILNYVLRAAEGDIDATVDSAVVSFATLPASETKARASTGFSLTDFNDGVPAELAGPGGLGMFTALYDGTTQFANLVPLLTANGGESPSLSDVRPLPPATWEMLGVPVYSMQVHHAFSLTARDLMSGQNTYIIMPEPGALALAALAGLFLRRR